MPSRNGPVALKTAIHVARARAGYPSDMAMAQAAGVAYETLMNWYGGRTVPRPAAVKKLASVLGVSYDSLLAAYEGRDPAPQELSEAIRDLIGEMRMSRIAQEQATTALQRAVERLLDRQEGTDTAHGPSGRPGAS